MFQIASLSVVAMPARLTGYELFCFELFDPTRLMLG